MPNNTIPQYDIFDRIFHFRPQALPIQICLALFVVLTVVSTAMTFKFRQDRYMWIIPAMAFAEVLGYITRLLFLDDKSLTTYIVSTLFILLPPIALALVNYIVVGKLLHQAGKPVKVFCWAITESRVTKIFLGSDVACFFLQGAGGGLMSSKDPKTHDLGRAVIISGLAIQVAFFTAFVYALFTVSLRSGHGLNKLPSLRNVYWGLWITTICIYIRNGYRLAEFSATEVMSLEWAFYVFESAVIICAFIAYNCFHFGMLLNRKAAATDDKPSWIKEFEAWKSASGEGKEGATPEGSSRGTGDV